MRKGVAIVGFTIFFFSLIVLVDGSIKLFAIGSCSDGCSQVLGAQGEILYGIVFGTIGGIFLLLGLLSDRRGGVALRDAGN